MALSPAPPQHPLEAARSLLKKGIAVPYSLPLPTEDTNWKVSFEKPTDITLVGSWANKISVKAQDGGRFGVDLAVEMPTVRSAFSVSGYDQSLSNLPLRRIFFKRKITLMVDTSINELSTWLL